MHAFLLNMPPPLTSHSLPSFSFIAFFPHSSLPNLFGICTPYLYQFTIPFERLRDILKGMHLEFQSVSAIYSDLFKKAQCGFISSFLLFLALSPHHSSYILHWDNFISRFFSVGSKIVVFPYFTWGTVLSIVLIMQNYFSF